MKIVANTNPTPGRPTVLAALIAGLCVSTCAYATPAPVVISQVYGAGGNNGASYNKDFIELFNRSSAPVSLSGWSVQYQSATGTTWAGTTALTNVTLQPGQYYLVTGAGGATGADVGTADASGTLNLSGTTGKVALVSQTALLNTTDGGDKVLDLVGFGTANRFEGTVAPAPSTTASISRLAGGCTDTDDNGADFAAGTINPRRTTAPLNACAGGPVTGKPIVLDCPASVAAQQGSAISAILRGADADSVVNSATITSAATAGISLSGFSAAPGIGGSASVSLDVSATLATGNYSVDVQFANNDNQTMSCTVAVKVAGSLTIPQIQGSKAKSDYANTVQTTQGVITAKVGSGFFLQDPNGDGDPTTSDAIFVFGSAGAAKVGDLIKVTGTVTEYLGTGFTRSYTELKDISGVTVQGSGYSITPTNIELPNADLARFEGMLVRFTSPLTVNGNSYLGDRGELVLSNGRREVPTNRYRPGTAEAIALATENANNVVVLDDGLFTTPPTIPYLGADGTVRSGDTVSDLTGVLDFGAAGGGGGYFKIQPTVTPVISRTNPRTDAPQLAAGNVKVASANVLNFFTVFTNGSDVNGNTGQGCSLGASVKPSNCRGADNMAEFVRQRDKIVNELKGINADVFGLMEIQNNGDTTVAYLVDQLNAAIGSPTYAYVPKPATTGTDAIRVAMIYKPASVTLVGGALSDGDAVNNRPPMAQTFKANNGARFSLIVNHLKSKGSCPSSGADDIDKNDGQECWNGTRVKQAQRLLSYFIPQVTASAGDSDVLVVGDMNAHGFEDPIALLTANGLNNEIERFVRPRSQPYSFIFDGESGYLDHALASDSLHAQVADVAEWHNNADEPDAIDYNLNDTPTDPYVNNAYRASDHDPVVISLALTPTFTDVTASVKVSQSGISVNRVTGKYSGTVSFTNTGATALNGPLNFVLDGLNSAIVLDNRSGMQNGAPYITVAGGLAPGASVTFTTTFSNPSKLGIAYTAKLISGTF